MDSSDVEVKVQLRREAIRRAGGDASARVLDLYSGSGVMRGLAYPDVANYLGIDMKDYGRADALVGDNLRLLPFAITQGDWNIFDLDAYSAPWVLADRVARLFKGESCQIIVTDNLRPFFNANSLDDYVKSVAGVQSISDGRLLGRWYPDIVRELIRSWERHGLRTESALCARPRGVKTENNGMSGSLTYYFLCTCVRISTEVRPKSKSKKELAPVSP